MKEIPAWLVWGLNELAKGICEIPGAPANPRILEYLNSVGLKETSDEIPWCSAAINLCFREIGMAGSGSAAARSWVGWGKRLDKFQLGAIAVFWRGSKDSWRGHVGIALADSGSMVTLLSPNTGNRWVVAEFPKKQLLSYRWPK